jgi:hypothetical protein
LQPIAARLSCHHALSLVDATPNLPDLKKNKNQNVPHSPSPPHQKNERTRARTHARTQVDRLRTLVKKEKKRRRGRRRSVAKTNTNRKLRYTLVVFFRKQIGSSVFSCTRRSRVFTLLEDIDTAFSSWPQPVLYSGLFVCLFFWFGW